MRTRSGFCLVCIAAAAVTATEAYAHEDDKLEEIVVTGRWDMRIGAMTSAAQGVVGQEEIDLRPRLRTGDILETVPGLIVTQHSGTGKSNQMFLRGFNLDHGTDFATWIDGMPINIPTHAHGQGYTDLNFLIPELIQTLEFKKGPYYADVSDFSSAGAAYLSTARTLDRGLLKTGVGENGFGQLLLADSFGAAGGDVLYGVQAHGYDGPWTNVDENLSRYNGVLRYSRSDSAVGEWNLTFMGYDAEWDSADQVPRRAVRSGLIDALGSVDETLGGETSRYSLSGRWHRDFGVDELTARAYAIDYRLNLFSNFTYFLDDPVNGDQFEQEDRRQIYGGDLVWRHEAGLDRVHNVGTQLRYDDISPVGLFRTRAQERIVTVRRDRVAQLSAALYYSYERRWNQRWHGSLGARLDMYRFDVKDSNIAANTGSETDAILSPKLNIVRVMSPNAEAYFSAGRGFHSNDARGAVTRVDPVTAAPAEPVDPLVSSTGVEIGYRYLLGSRLNLSASLWYLELDSELLFVGDAGNTEASRPSRRYGLEVPLYYRVDDTWMLDLELALTDSAFTEIDPAGDAIPGSLDRVLSAGLSAQFQSGYYGNLRVRHFGERPLTEDESAASGSSTIWNLGVGLRTENFDVRVEALNLFDSNADDISYFYASRLPGEPAGGIDDEHYHPTEPRSVRAYVSWFFGARDGG